MKHDSRSSLAKAIAASSSGSNPSSMPSSSSSSSNSSSPVMASSGSVKRKKIGKMRSICSCCNRCPTAPDTMHMVRINARVSPASPVMPLACFCSLALRRPALPRPSARSICVRSRWTMLTKSASLRTTDRHPSVFPALLRMTGAALFESCWRQICRMGSCCRATEREVAPNRARRSVRMSKHDSTISSDVLRTPSSNRPTSREDVTSPSVDGIVLMRVRKPMAYTSRSSFLDASKT
mmetsp:Transcript_4362/g.12529  ORF Transcript_4362/g.12529 Transcript_4362/m.12529 type:complete len:237 (-) Transcript_4362:97-807(-)